MYEIQLRIYRSSADNYQILWNDGIHLLDTGKPILGQNFVNRINIYIYIYIYIYIILYIYYTYIYIYIGKMILF